jgi:hypothetical protein
MPRRSNRVDEKAIELTPDGDTWQEKICVCEGLGRDGKTPRLVLKSYYRNNRTLHKVWDEPPTGASTIRFASQQDRRKAEAQLKELQQTLNMIPLETSSASSASTSPTKGRGGSFFSRFRRKKDKSTEEVHESQDVNLQKAIARSMMDHHRVAKAVGTAGMGGTSASISIIDPVISPKVHFDPENGFEISHGHVSGEDSTTNPSGSPKSSYSSSLFDDSNDDEDMALAKALSVSESYAASVVPLTEHAVSPHESSTSSSTLSEDEMLQLAIRESQRDATRERGASGISVRVKRLKRRSNNNRLPQQDIHRSFESFSPEPIHDDDWGNWDLMHPSPRVQRGDIHDYSGNFVPQRHSNIMYHHRRRVTRPKDPPADPPSRYMEEDNDEEDAELEYDHDERPNLDRHRGHLFGRTPNGRKDEWYEH